MFKCLVIIAFVSAFIAFPPPQRRFDETFGCHGASVLSFTFNNGFEDRNSITNVHKKPPSIHQHAVHEFVQAVFTVVDVEDILLGRGSRSRFLTDPPVINRTKMSEEIGHGPIATCRY